MFCHIFSTVSFKDEAFKQASCYVLIIKLVMKLIMKLIMKCVCILGNLYFANIQKSDENDGLKYQCQVELSKIGAIIYGAFSIIKVDQGKAAYLMFSLVEIFWHLQ